MSKEYEHQSSLIDHVNWVPEIDLEDYKDFLLRCVKGWKKPRWEKGWYPRAEFFMTLILVLDRLYS